MTEEVFEFSVDLEGNLSDDEILEYIRKACLKLNALFTLRGGNGLRVADIETDEEMGVEVSHSMQYGIRNNTHILLRLIPIATAEDISIIIKDFRLELEENGLELDIDSDNECDSPD